MKDTLKENIIKEFRKRFGYENLVGVERERFEHQEQFLSSLIDKTREETIKEIKLYLNSYDGKGTKLDFALFCFRFLESFSPKSQESESEYRLWCAVCGERGICLRCRFIDRPKEGQGK